MHVQNYSLYATSIISQGWRIKVIYINTGGSMKISWSRINILEVLRWELNKAPEWQWNLNSTSFLPLFSSKVFPSLRLDSYSKFFFPVIVHSPVLISISLSLDCYNMVCLWVVYVRLWTMNLLPCSGCWMFRIRVSTKSGTSVSSLQFQSISFSLYAHEQ